MSELSPIQPLNLVPQKKVHPLLGSLPAHLKDHKNFDKIQRLLLNTLGGKHSHGEVVEWAGCASCQRRFRERGHVLKGLGFKSPAQYRLWVRTHQIIKGMFKSNPLPKYDDPI